LRAAALPVLPSLDGARIGDLTAGPGLTPFPPKARSRGPLLKDVPATPRPTPTFFAEPQKTPHFAWAKDGEVIVQVTGVGPSGVTFIDQSKK